MTDILLSGCLGHMGGAVTRAADGYGCRIAAGVDCKAGEQTEKYPVFGTFGEVNVNADVIIDFSTPALLSDLLSFATGIGMPAVIATTGYTDAQIEQIKAAAEKIPVFFSFNMSLGINLLKTLAKTAAAILGDGFDIEIIEKHHNQKVDAPSGTALMLADAVNDGRKKYIYERHSRREKRGRDEIGIHSVRAGTIVGEHEIIFAGTDEIITLSHSAASKAVFAAGALNAANFIRGEKPGLYSMDDIVSKHS